MLSSTSLFHLELHIFLLPLHPHPTAGAQVPKCHGMPWGPALICSKFSQQLSCNSSPWIARRPATCLTVSPLVSTPLTCLTRLQHSKSAMFFYKRYLANPKVKSSNFNGTQRIATVFSSSHHDRCNLFKDLLEKSQADSLTENVTINMWSGCQPLAIQHSNRPGSSSRGGSFTWLSQSRRVKNVPLFKMLPCL